MASSVKGIIVEIGGDTSGLQKALSKVNSATSSLSKELRGVNSLLKLDPKNTELLAQKQDILANSIEETENKLKLLHSTYQRGVEAEVDGAKISEDNWRALQREIINTENKLKNLKLETSNWTNAGRKIEEIGTKIENLGNRVDNLGNKLTTRITAPLVALGVVGVKSAAEQETAMQQVELIYGEASKGIKDFAENTAISYNMSTKEAYKYSQIYGNLIQSITDDEEENARYTQDLLKASAVIASSTGRTMEDVMDRIRSGLLGNTEAIEDLGVNVNVALLESTDAFKQFAGDKSWEQLDFQTQQQIRLFGILEQTTKKYGDEINDNTASNIQKLTAKFNNMTSKLNKKLLPLANKLIDKADKLMDKIGDLTDEEAENIIKTGLMVAAAGPLVKILGTTTKTIGGTVKGIGLFTQAIGVMKTGSQSSSKEVNNIAKVLSALTSPAGLATTAIAATAAGLVYLANKQTKAQKQAEEFAKEMSSQKQTLLEYNRSIDEVTNANIAQIDSVSKLKDELVNLVDENGKVKEGYESRVEFILDQLNEALGTEYKLNGDIIDSYKNLQKEIDNTIEKKKAEIRLNADEEKYKNAIENQTQAVEDMKTAYENLQKTQEEYGLNLDELREKAQNLYDMSENQWITGGNPLAISAYKKQAEAIQNVIDAYDDAEYRVKDYTEKVKTYETNYQLFVEEKYEEIGKTVKDRTKNWTEESINTIKENIINEKNNLDAYKTIYENTGNEIALEQQKQSEENLTKLAEELIKRTSTIEQLGEDEIAAWKTLGENSYDEYKKALNKMAPEMKQKIQDTTGIIIGDTTLKEATKKLGEEANEGFNDNVDAAEWGNDLVNVLSSTLISTKSKGIISSAAEKLAKWIANYIHFSLPEKGPLSDMDESMPDMIELMANGIDNNRYRLINSAQKLSKELNNSLSYENSKLSTKVMNGSKTIYTTPQIVFNVQELDEAKLQQCFNYINRKFGSAY